MAAHGLAFGKPEDRLRGRRGGFRKAQSPLRLGFAEPPCMGLSLSRGIFSIASLCSTVCGHPSVPTYFLAERRAQSPCPGCRLRHRRSPARQASWDRVEHGAIVAGKGPHDSPRIGVSTGLGLGRADRRLAAQGRPEGNLPGVAAKAPRPCIRRIAAIRTHDAVMRIGGKAPRWRFPFSPARMEIMP